MGDHGKYYSNFDESYGTSMRRLLPYSDVILPNLTEMYLLAEKEYQGITEMSCICAKNCAKWVPKI